jgi:hypothetical protein
MAGFHLQYITVHVLRDSQSCNRLYHFSNETSRGCMMKTLTVQEDETGPRVGAGPLLRMEVGEVRVAEDSDFALLKVITPRKKDRHQRQKRERG